MYDARTMKQKSITFRCSPRQHQRLSTAMSDSRASRTHLITTALSNFLDYAEQEHIRHLNLHDLVRDIDVRSEGPPFREQA